MFNLPLDFRALVLACALAGCGFHSTAYSQKYPHIGRPATPAEVAAWDIDVRPDFKGLPAGSGSVAKGQDVWEAKCASCHGVFGESNQVFSPLVGGTAANDVQTGNVAALKDNSFPGRTTLMKLATVSTLWDYINRAMPWTAPKSLTVEEVYAVTAYLLNLGGVVPENFSLSNTNMPQVQALMPNRNGMGSTHALWPGPELGGAKKADVQATACMHNCGPEPKVASFIPDFARNAHGNLAEQNRLVGSQRGVDTNLATQAQNVPAATAPATSPVPAQKPPASVATGQSASIEKSTAVSDGKTALALANKYSCTACHAMAQKVVGPAFAEIAKRYPGQANELAQKIVKGGVGVWGPIPMPPQAINNSDAKVLAAWLSNGAAR